MQLQRLIEAGGVKLTAWLLAICLVLVLLLGFSAWLHWQQEQSKSAAVADLTGKLAAAKAKGESDLAACEGTSNRNAANVVRLAAEVQACRGDNQQTELALADALRWRDRAKREAEGERAMRAEVIRRIYETNADCRQWAAGAVCRARSDELLNGAKTPAAQ